MSKLSARICPASLRVYGSRVMLYSIVYRTRAKAVTMSEPTKDDKAWRAPYMSYETLTNFFDKKLGDNPVPPRIDQHFLDNYAGSVRPILVATLKTMGMLDENNQVLGLLHEAVKSPDNRKAVFRAWAEDFYAEQIQLAGQHATAQMLWETFSKQGGLTGSTLRRAVIFYLAFSKDVGLPLSAHFKSPKAPPSAQKSPRPSSSSPPPPADTETPESDSSVHDGASAHERRNVTLGTAGTVEIIVNVRWLDLSDDQFTRLRKLIKDIESLGQSGDDRDEEDAEGAS
jgi:hypothetical protein